MKHYIVLYAERALGEAVDLSQGQAKQWLIILFCFKRNWTIKYVFCKC
jgi:hypothetical protein